MIFKSSCLLLTRSALVDLSLRDSVFGRRLFLLPSTFPNITVFSREFCLFMMHCEGDQHSVPSSEESRQDMIAGCAVGELIKIEEGERGRNKAVEQTWAKCSPKTTYGQRAAPVWPMDSSEHQNHV